LPLALAFDLALAGPAPLDVVGAGVATGLALVALVTAVFFKSSLGFAAFVAGFARTLVGTLEAAFTTEVAVVLTGAFATTGVDFLVWVLETAGLALGMVFVDFALNAARGAGFALALMGFFDCAAFWDFAGAAGLVIF